MNFDDKDKLVALAQEENWLTPLADVRRVTLRPWQQAVFWGLRVYIVVILVIMGWGFYHSLGH